MKSARKRTKKKRNEDESGRPGKKDDETGMSGEGIAESVTRREMQRKREREREGGGESVCRTATEWEVGAKGRSTGRKRIVDMGKLDGRRKKGCRG
jgi:hypothetical protein